MTAPCLVRRRQQRSYAANGTCTISAGVRFCITTSQCGRRNDSREQESHIYPSARLPELQQGRRRERGHFYQRRRSETGWLSQSQEVFLAEGEEEKGAAGEETGAPPSDHSVHG